MKIILIIMGSMGDIRPMTALALTLRKDGHEVEICVPPNFTQFVSDYGFKNYPYGYNFEAIFQEDNDMMGNPLNGVKKMFPLFKKSISDQFTSLLEIADGADLVIGQLLDSVGRSVAEYKGIQYLYYCYVPILFKSRYHPPMGLPFQNLPHWMNRSIWWLYDVVVSKFVGNIVNENRKKLGMGVVKHVMEYQAENALLSMNHALAPMPPDIHSNYFQTGYWHFEDDKELYEELNQFIAAGEPPIYIGFGSMTDPHPEETSKILQEVIDSQRFRLIISRGWAKLATDRVNSNVFFVDYVPHAKLFPKLAAVVHHGGVGTTHTTLRAGVPQVVVPHSVDQYYWGERVYRAKIGPKPINRLKLTSKNLIAAINEAVTNPELRSNAKKMGEIEKQEKGLEEALQYINSLKRS